MEALKSRHFLMICKYTTFPSKTQKCPKNFNRFREDVARKSPFDGICEMSGNIFA